MSLRVKSCEGGHDDELFSFKSRHVDKALVDAAFYRSCVVRTMGHPMRYWAAAGWGPVPVALKAPEGIYRELELVDKEIVPGKKNYNLSDFSCWYEFHQAQNIIFFQTYHHFPDDDELKLKWVAVIDVRDDTTVQNLRIPPKGSEAFVWSARDLQMFRPPATGREYIEMTRGELLVREFTDSDGHHGWLRVVANVGNAAVGKWFWECYPRCDGSFLSQLVIWHESVDDLAEYRTPQQGPDDVIKRWAYRNRYRKRSDSRLIEEERRDIVEERKEALAVVDIFLWTADAEPQIRHAMAQFMTMDPNGLWWGKAELPDGFLLSDFHVMDWSPFMTIGELRSEKLCFASEARVFNGTGHLSARRMFDGCAVGIHCALEASTTDNLLSIQFKPSRATGQIVAMRAVFKFEDHSNDR